MNPSVRKVYRSRDELSVWFFHTYFCVRCRMEELKILSQTQKFSDWEAVVLYVWFLHLKEQKAPYLSGLREPLIDGAIPPTLFLKDIPWFPPMQVAGQTPQNLGELTCLYKWKKVQARIQWILELWLKQDLPLKVTEEVITPYEMLELQSRGWRVVTLPFNHQNLEADVVPGKKPLAFVLHDLEHAERFFHNLENYEGQVGFYHWLQTSVVSGFWKKHLKDPEFEKAFFYLMSDMNTHCVHMLKYLRAILWQCLGTKSEKVWSDLTKTWGLPEQFVEIEQYFVHYGRLIRPKEFFK